MIHWIMSLFYPPKPAAPPLFGYQLAFLGYAGWQALWTQREVMTICDGGRSWIIPTTRPRDKWDEMTVRSLN